MWHNERSMASSVPLFSNSIRSSKQIRMWDGQVCGIRSFTSFVRIYFITFSDYVKREREREKCFILIFLWMVLKWEWQCDEYFTVSVVLCLFIIHRFVVSKKCLLFFLEMVSGYIQGFLCIEKVLYRIQTSILLDPSFAPSD